MRSVLARRADETRVMPYRARFGFFTSVSTLAAAYLGSTPRRGRYLGGKRVKWYLPRRHITCLSFASVVLVVTATLTVTVAVATAAALAVITKHADVKFVLHHIPLCLIAVFVGICKEFINSSKVLTPMWCLITMTSLYLHNNIRFKQFGQL